MSTAGEFNLSYECLTGYKTCEKLRNLKTTDLAFWEELTQTTTAAFDELETYEEDEPPNLDAVINDDSDLPCGVIVTHVLDLPRRENVATTPDGDLVSSAAAEALEDDEGTSESVPAPPVVEEFGPGKRKRTANKFYNDTRLFWRHNDLDDADDDSLLP